MLRCRLCNMCARFPSKVACAIIEPDFEAFRGRSVPQHSGPGRGRQGRYPHDGAIRQKQKRKSSLPFLTITTLCILFVLGGLYFGCVFITTAFSWIPIPRPPVPIIGGQGDNLPSWKGTDRVNILLLGLDQREDERGQPTRSDTMIVVTLDPVSKSAGMLSIPRDLLVQIPGHGENKINTANFFGDVDKKGNGPLLAKKVVQDLLGVPIHYYARIDFAGFEKMIDMVGGVDVDVDKALKDDEYPTENYGVMRIYVPVGLQHMDGRTALRYARSRHEDSDFGRAQRQRKVLLAARDKALQLNLLPKLPGMLNAILQSIQTDIPPTDMLALARLAKDIDSSSIVSRSIDESMVEDVNREGSSLQLRPGELPKLVSQVFSDSRSKQEAAKIEVQNGTSRAGLAASVANTLKSASYTVVRIGNATTDYKETVIINYSGKSATVAALAKMLKVPAKNIRNASAGDKSDVDVLIILGQDTPAP